MSRFSVVPVVGDYVDTLRDVQTHRPRWLDRITIYGAPPVVGLAVVVVGVRLQGIGELLGGLAILAGFLFALVLFVFQLRLAVTSDPRIPATGLLPRLIDQLFATVSYAVLVGLTTTGTAMAAAAARAPDSSGGLQPINVWWSAVFAALCLHLALLLLAALRQTRVAYLELRR